jgi:hypothetical protein
MSLLEEYMQKFNDYNEASRLANEQAEKMANEQFEKLRDQLSQIEHYKADGYCCISKGERKDCVRCVIAHTRSRR